MRLMSMLWTTLLLLLVCVANPAANAAPPLFVPNDDRDDTRGVQLYLDALTRPETQHRPPLPAGRLLISDTLKIHRTMGYRLSGSGGVNRSRSKGWDRHRVGTILVWTGPPDKPILEVSGCSGMVIEGINFDGPASAGILIRSSGGSLNFAIRDCAFMGQAVGIQCGSSYEEGTCANITYDNCHFEALTEACVRMVNAQSVEHLFLRPLFVRSPVGIDMTAGGVLAVVGGGAYELDTFLRLGQQGSNNRGFSVQGFRFDGQGTRTQWLAFANPHRARTFGTITFANCSQSHGQKQSDEPLITVAPGSRVVVRECSFSAAPLVGGNLAHIHSDRRASGELIVENCDGLGGDNLVDYIRTHGDRAYYTFRRCGNLYGQAASISNFPGEELSAPELQNLRELANLETRELRRLIEAVRERDATEPSSTSGSPPGEESASRATGGAE